MKKILIALLVCLISVSALAKKKEKQEMLKIPTGTNAPSISMAFDASYDPRTDNIIPGYKILSVAISNNSINLAQMDKVGDEWYLIDYKGNKHRAITDLKKSDPEVYIALPEKLRVLITYPEYIQTGETKVIDLLYRDSVNIDGFRALRLESKLRGIKLEIEAKD